jgi:hypothetical protein
MSALEAPNVHVLTSPTHPLLASCILCSPTAWSIDMDAELVRAWQLIVELSEQNARNQKIATELKAQANQLQVRRP